MNHHFSFLKDRRVRTASTLLLLHAVALYSSSRPETLPVVAALQQFPSQIGAWAMDTDLSMEKEVFDRLHPDDYLIRSYVNPANMMPVNVFVAYFRTQRTGHMPHSPKNCLPGSGWVPRSADVIDLPVQSGQLRINRNIVQRGETQALVLYWYQNWNRVDFSEYAARVHLFADSIRYNRTDTALVRVTVPIVGDEPAANATASEFARLMYGQMRKQFPASDAADARQPLTTVSAKPRS